MTKLTKKKKQLLELVNPENTYSLEEAMNIFQTVKSNKFDESVDIALRLGIDPGKSDQNVRGAITLPHSLGKTVTVAVFADGDQAKEANDAGADFVGMEDLAEKFKKEEIVVDVVISSQAAMKIVGQLGQVLGPKGLMPNPKTGTVTEKVGEAINNAKSGQVRFRTDKNGILHGCIGKVSFSSSQIQENAAAMLEEVRN
jgi:large subunit ribosomal protein L1